MSDERVPLITPKPVAVTSAIFPGARPVGGAPKTAALGEKSIGVWLSFVYIINQIYGPGVLAIPIVFQQAGWVVTLLSLVGFMIISAFASTTLCDAMTVYPGNTNFEQRVEFGILVKHFYGKRWYFVFQVLFNVCIQSINIASIAICAQSMDGFLEFMFDKTFALQLSGDHIGFIETSNASPFYLSVWGITLGYILIVAVGIPMSFTNLDDNVKVVQLASFIFMMLLIFEFIWSYIYTGIDFTAVPAFGTNYTQVVSVFIFSWTYPMLIPSWVNEKKDHVSINKSIWGSVLFSTVGYIAVGLLAALAYPNLAQDNVLPYMGTRGNPTITRISTYLFSLTVILPGIPVFCITTRYGLYVGGICGKKQSYFWGVIAPWLVAFIFNHGTAFAQLLTWTSLVVNGVVNFIFPFMLYIKARRVVNRAIATTVNVQGSFKAVPGAVAMEDEILEKPADEAGLINEYSGEFFKVGAYPRFCDSRAVLLTIALIVITVAVLLFQIGLNLIYLAVLHKNLLSG